MSTPSNKPQGTGEASGREIKLSIDSLEVKDRAKRWNLLFTIITNHPTDQNQTLIGVFPPDGQEIKLGPKSHHKYSFVPEGGKPGDGVTLLSITDPEIKEMDIQLYIKDKTELVKVADVIGTLTKKLNAKPFEHLPGFLGKAASWVSVASESVGEIINLIKRLPDRDMGLIAIDQGLSEINSDQPTKTYSNTSSTGEIALTWTWELLT